MLSHPPKLTYSGITVVMSNQSRFDNKVLLSGNGGGYFNECLSPHFNRYQCDIRLLQDERPLVKGTKAILLLGEYALRKYKREVSLNEQRGHPFEIGSIQTIATYNPQDTQDQKDYESMYNELVVRQDEERYGAEGAQDDKRRHGKTDRSNFAFWFKKDMQKVIAITHNNGILPSMFVSDFVYHYWPDVDTLLPQLRNTKGKTLYFDIETDANLNITVFAFSFGHPDVFIVPVLDWNYNLSYKRMGEIFAALAIAIRNNILVAHNGANFDYYILAHKYRISINKIYDTMLAQNRIYPEVEKSLGHTLSLPWIFEQYHKDESVFNYHNEQQFRKHCMYCGKDVSSLVRLKKAQDEYAAKRPGLRSSIDSVNSYVRPYLTTTLTGIRYDKEKLTENIVENDKKCNSYLKMLDMLIGAKTLKEIRRGGTGSICSSSSQAVRYFHDMLKYPLMMKSKKTGKASLSAEAIYKLKLWLAAQEKSNPCLDIIIAFRQVAKETGTLKFIPWKDSI